MLRLTLPSKQKAGLLDAADVITATELAELQNGELDQRLAKASLASAPKRIGGDECVVRSRDVLAARTTAASMRSRR